MFTDPPYFGNVQYAELMDFCYVWLRKLLSRSIPEFMKPSTRHQNELTGNANMGRGLDHFAEGMSRTLCLAAQRLESGRPLAFTYHHNQLDAYIPLAVAMLDSSMVCSASLPCPAEMGASIHINGTESSIVDTVFVCRSTGRVPRRWIVDNALGVAGILQRDVEDLAAGGLTVTQGDIKCVCFGHLIRLAVWFLRKDWDATWPIGERLEKVGKWLKTFGGVEAVSKELGATFADAGRRQQWKPEGAWSVHEEQEDEISF